MNERNAILGPQVRATFELVDHHGQEVTERTYRGRPVLVFFGFTHCKMVCPRALARLSAVLDRLGEVGDGVQALYVTVDPERDSPEVMKEFLSGEFHRFTGLTGTAEQVENAKRSFRVFAKNKTADPDDPGGYQMPHSAFTYLLDEKGSVVAHFSDAVPESELVQRLSNLLVR
jgi:protein SCO1/2